MTQTSHILFLFKYKINKFTTYAISGKLFKKKNLNMFRMYVGIGY